MSVGFRNYDDPSLQPPEAPLFLECDGCDGLFREERLTLEEGCDKFLCGSCLEETLLNRDFQS